MRNIFRNKHTLNFSRRNRFITVVVLLQLLILSCTSIKQIASNYAGQNWSEYAGDNTKSRYSSLRQVNKQNVGQLQIAWKYRSGDLSSKVKTTNECNPQIINGVVYASTPTLKLVALSGSTGKELWRFDPLPAKMLDELRVKEKLDILPGTGYWINRGVVYYENGKDKRIYYSAGIFLFAINATSGELISNFGENGKIDLRQGLGYSVSSKSLIGMKRDTSFKSNNSKI